MRPNNQAGSIFSTPASLYLTEAINAAVSDLTAVSGGGIGAFLELLPEIQGALGEVFDKSEFAPVLAELATLRKVAPHAFRLIEHLAGGPKSTVVRSEGQDEKESLPPATLLSYLDDQFPPIEWFIEVDFAPDQGGGLGGKLYVTITDEPSDRALAKFTHS